MTEYQILKRHKFLCRGKVKHSSEASAMDALIEQMVRPDSYLADQLSIYICKACSYLHIGHEPKWSRNGKRENDNTNRQTELQRARKEALFRAIDASKDSRPPFHVKGNSNRAVDRGSQTGQGRIQSEFEIATEIDRSLRGS